MKYHILILALVTHILSACSSISAPKVSSSEEARVLDEISWAGSQIRLAHGGNRIWYDQDDSQYKAMFQVILSALNEVKYKPHCCEDLIRTRIYTSVDLSLVEPVYFSTGHPVTRELLTDVRYWWSTRSPTIAVTLNKRYQLTINKKDAPLLLRWANAELNAKDDLPLAGI